MDRPGAEPTEGLRDRHHRCIDYLRLSITDRCNLNCFYCLPPEGVPQLPRVEILRYEEIIRVARIALDLGMRKIRLTGGEPLLRRDVVYLCQQLSQLPGLQSFSLTTNGVRLAPLAAALYAAGVQRLNISLDTLNPAKYARITGRDHFAQVWEGIITAQAVGFFPIKMNVVLLKGVNDDEIAALARLTYEYPFHVRFIELMPFSRSSEHFLATTEVLARLQRLDTLMPTQSRHNNGPARYYCFPGAVGKIGLISPRSQHFCESCNRLRVTADGQVFACLFAIAGHDLKALLRRGATDAEISAWLRHVIWHKPRQAPEQLALSRKCLPRPMVAMGG